MSTEKSQRTKPTLKLVLVEEGRTDDATWVVIPDIDAFVGDLNKAVTYARDCARRDREKWDAETDRILKLGSTLDASKSS